MFELRKAVIADLLICLLSGCAVVGVVSTTASVVGSAFSLATDVAIVTGKTAVSVAGVGIDAVTPSRAPSVAPAAVASPPMSK